MTVQPLGVPLSSVEAGATFIFPGNEADIYLRTNQGVDADHVNCVILATGEEQSHPKATLAVPVDYKAVPA